MSTYDEIDHAVEVLGKEDLILMHATSTYPANYDELNLRAIPIMAARYGVPVGYSGHETGIPTSVCAAALGRLLCRTPHHPGPRRLGLRSGGFAGAERHYAPGARYSTLGAGQRRRHQARLRARIPHHQKASPRRRGSLGRDAMEANPANGDLKRIRAVVFDVDGVLTDGGLWWGPGGEEWKRFCFADIMGVSLARRAGFELALISGEDSPLVSRYAEKMHIRHVVKGCRDKAAALREIAASAGIELAEICYMGDDVNDLPAMQIAGFSAAPASAASRGSRPGRICCQEHRRQRCGPRTDRGATGGARPACAGGLFAPMTHNQNHRRFRS